MPEGALRWIGPGSSNSRECYTVVKKEYERLR
jgi:hypothetical protein